MMQRRKTMIATGYIADEEEEKEMENSRLDINAE